MKINKKPVYSILATGPRILFSKWKILSILLITFSWNFSAQEIKAEIDTSSIKIGEQITYRIAVMADSSSVIVFPEGQTFMPLEMVESYPVDTLKAEDSPRYIKEYALTQFDSGSYVIPQQRILINNRAFLTDSLLVEVSSVAVDTTRQKLFPIKPSIEIPPEVEFPRWIWWVIGAIVLFGLAYFLYIKRKKKKEEAKKLPPYEQALFELERLDKSHLLEDREIKEYYSQLSLAVRRYYDQEVYDHAMESTSGELITYLQKEKGAGHLRISEETIENLYKILQRSDLAKFANSKPDVITAKEDRKRIENIINDTKSSIPEPTEEELLRDEKYRRKKENQKRKKKIIAGAALTAFLIAAIVAYIISTEGFGYLKETLLGNETKELLEEEWIRSEYGNPPVAITTPEVLIRRLNDSLEKPQLYLGKESFESGNMFGNYFVRVSTFELGPQSNFNLQDAVDGMVDYLEKMGAENIILKQEEITTINGAGGIRVFGDFNIINPITEEPVKKKYSILNFSVGGGFEQVIMVYDEDDPYADEITQRIINSVELINLQTEPETNNNEN
ncbi:MAG TPA: DUF4381 domain-containing protein [Salinimicrobium sp.]|nr:DUF4381 domain-containing protein [Salinimicrobium sp.]